MQIISDFRVNNKAEIAIRLDAAVAIARNRADIDRTLGVLVTRHNFDHCSVALSPRIPFGLTIEQDHALR